GFKVKVLDLCSEQAGLLDDEIGSGGHRACEVGQKCLRNLLVGLVVLCLGSSELIPGPGCPVECVFQKQRSAEAHGFEPGAIERRRVHLARSLVEVVRFVDEETDLPLVDVSQTEEWGGRVEVIVVVAHYY